ncbi:MAG: hypothetical protein C5B53_11550 [Candidatus Melainabacteria bacterium]|nr:MAG: hypothetical protein C5B53_11550 [Candidatus Melainabacteria bacterium]
MPDFAEVSALKRINSRLNQLKTATSLVCFALLSTAAFAQPAKTTYTANVSEMDAILKSKPNDESAHYYRAVAFQNAGDYQKAKADYQWVSSHARNPVLVRYATSALKALTPSAGTQTQTTSQSRPAQATSVTSTGKYSIMRVPAGQQR